ncbi:polysaccharide pyruvyl transferase family protein [Aestuariivivens marinum]|uniref:polysaccharide pyruvyl transferase family protein n=1 Tax=Aestuariivivens marinum TaxID=2913555 RepID=UPI001F5A31D2|nr:polysaccharide pyruvyl transferase family protein [Aestuariivivens marinum]
MALRTYYWDQRNVSLFKYYRHKFRNPKHLVFKKGNAGDIFNIDLIKYLYNESAINIKNKGNRLLLVGSIISKIKEGDIINGVGWKGNDIHEDRDLIKSLKVYGVRGPLTRSLFEKYGTDLSNLKFEYDPGLLIKEVYNLNLSRSSESQVIFIPHFMDTNVYNGKYPSGIKVINVDNSPKKIAKEILKSKHVYASSLHGIIFSHALNKPCTFVRPQSKEPMFKYRDYFLSIDKELPEPVRDIYSVNYILNKATTLEREIGLKDFYFPEKDNLKKLGVIY